MFLYLLPVSSASDIQETRTPGQLNFGGIKPHGLNWNVNTKLIGGLDVCRNSPLLETGLEVDDAFLSLADYSSVSKYFT
jgi:hypothetical protein